MLKLLVAIACLLATYSVYASCPSSVVLGAPDSPVELADSLKDDPAFARMHLANIARSLPGIQKSCRQGVEANCRLAEFVERAKAGLECYAGISPSNQGGSQSTMQSGSARAVAGAREEGNAGGKQWWGKNTDCAQLAQLETKSNAQWFSFTNRCNMPIYVVYKTNGGFSRMILEPGQTDKSWFLTGSGDLKYAACMQRSPSGESVHFDEKANNCYYFRR